MGRLELGSVGSKVEMMLDRVDQEYGLREGDMLMAMGFNVRGEVVEVCEQLGGTSIRQAQLEAFCLDMGDFFYPVVELGIMGRLPTNDGGGTFLMKAQCVDGFGWEKTIEC